MAYDDSRFDHERLNRYASKVAAALTARDVPQHGPRPERTTERIKKTGPLGLRRQSVVERDDGGSPRFWPVTSRRSDGTLHHTPDSGLYTRVQGDAILLLLDGGLLYANYEAERGKSGVPGPYFSDLEPATADRLLFFDRADRGRWLVESHGQNYRERFDRHYTLTAHAKGVGVSVALKRLLEGGNPNWDLSYTG